MNNMVMIVPQKITAPIGIHNGLLPITMGITPIEAAAEVRKMGRIRRRADS